MAFSSFYGRPNLDVVVYRGSTLKCQRRGDNRHGTRNVRVVSWVSYAALASRQDRRSGGIATVVFRRQSVDSSLLEGADARTPNKAGARHNQRGRPAASV